MAIYIQATSWESGMVVRAFLQSVKSRYCFSCHSDNIPEYQETTNSFIIWLKEQQNWMSNENHRKKNESDLYQ